MLDEHEVWAARQYISLYQTYQKCRALELQMSAKDFTPETLSIIYEMHAKIVEMERNRKRT